MVILTVGRNVYYNHSKIAELRISIDDRIVATLAFNNFKKAEELIASAIKLSVLANR